MGSYRNLLGDKLEELADSVTPYNLASDKTPPAFIWHTASDASVDVCNTYRYAAKLRELLVPSELHIFPFGAHGLGLASDPNHTEPYVRMWADLLEKWLTLYGFID